MDIITYLCPNRLKTLLVRGAAGMQPRLNRDYINMGIFWIQTTQLIINKTNNNLISSHSLPNDTLKSIFFERNVGRTGLEYLFGINSRKSEFGKLPSNSFSLLGGQAINLHVSGCSYLDIVFTNVSPAINSDSSGHGQVYLWWIILLHQYLNGENVSNRARVNEHNK